MRTSNHEELVSDTNCCGVEGDVLVRDYTAGSWLGVSQLKLTIDSNRIVYKPRG